MLIRLLDIKNKIYELSADVAKIARSIWPKNSFKTRCQLKILSLLISSYETPYLIRPRIWESLLTMGSKRGFKSDKKNSEQTFDEIFED